MGCFAPDRVAGMGYFDPAQVATLLDEHFAARENHENKIWALLMFTLWHDIYMNGTNPESMASLIRDGTAEKILPR